MKLRFQPSAIFFDGILDEEASLDFLNSAYAKAHELGGKPPVSVDLSAVTRANSTGILSWLRFVKASQVQFKYDNAPVWLVGQFNSISGFFENDSFVESLAAPFFDEKKNETKNVIFFVGRDIPLLPDYSDFKVANRTIAGTEFEPDFEPAKYFQFLSKNFEKFKKHVESAS